MRLNLCYSKASNHPPGHPRDRRSAWNSCPSVAH